MDAGRDEQIALVALLRDLPNGPKWSELALRVMECGSATSVWAEDQPTSALFGDDAPGDLLDRAGRALDEWVSSGLEVLTLLDRRYPAQLREIEQVPPLLFARGTLVPGDRGVSVVGSRKASAGAVAFAMEVAARLVDAGLTVIAGLAEGIDTAAHTAALDAGGRTVAFIGTGIRARSFPAANRALQETIANDGLLLSQFWPDAPGHRHHFLLRNAIMSGYGRATVVVEAGEKSGTRAQARIAVEHGRPVILTDRVAGGTDWGAALVGRPGVFVADSPAAVMDIVREITRPLADHLNELIRAS